VTGVSIPAHWEKLLIGKPEKEFRHQQVFQKIILQAQLKRKL
jgi:hypothetical protein